MNAIDKIHELLIEKRIKYEVDTSSEETYFKLLNSSLAGYIMVEGDECNDKEEYWLTFYIPKNDDNHDNTLYEDSDELPLGEIENYLDGLLEEISKYNTVIRKVEKKIEDIKSICEEYDINHEMFITINFDFDA